MKEQLNTVTSSSEIYASLSVGIIEVLIVLALVTSYKRRASLKGYDALVNFVQTLEAEGVDIYDGSLVEIFEEHVVNNPEVLTQFLLAKEQLIQLYQEVQNGTVDLEEVLGEDVDEVGRQDVMLILSEISFREEEIDETDLSFLQIGGIQLATMRILDEYSYLEGIKEEVAWANYELGATAAIQVVFALMVVLVAMISKIERREK